MPEKQNKFYYAPHHAHHFKYPENDSIKQYLSIGGSGILTDDKIDTIKFSYEWHTSLNKLKYLKAIETRLYYADSNGKKVTISSHGIIPIITIN